MKHLNGHIICAVDTETTGLQPRYNDLVQIAVIPLDMQLKPDSNYLPFELKVKPRRPENLNLDALRHNKNIIGQILLTGLDPDVAADLFNEWFEGLNLPEGKRIMPLAHNWIFDAQFIEDWLGYENFHYIFDGRYRDTQTMSLYVNDVAEAQVENCPFPKHSLQYLVRCLKLNLDPNRSHDALYDALKTAEVYRAMVHHNLIDLRYPLSDEC